MQKNAAVLTVACILLCLAFNYTFPLHRDVNLKWPFIGSYRNHTQFCRALHHVDISERTKKMTNNIENAMKKLKESAHDIYFNGIKKLDKIKLSDDDVHQFELSVIMKKYPYLDLKELALKLSPLSNKNTRQSSNVEPEDNFGSDPSLCESVEDVINVEIMNRGLSGFSIPPKLVKSVSMVENKLKLNDFKKQIDKSEKLLDISKATVAVATKRDVLNSLKDDIVAYEEAKNDNRMKLF
ncbi:uncharacterized protein ACR2FA_011967 [Aphomia sociella]